ncbi:hypothetical protein Tco_1055713 [Tanacetum coccineum]|uniref:Uncharacterized protein n=1 Tax=Tanacetum coccineum TaxID=301880 RepID=A0ABQ5H1L9_9ASTR
MHSSKKKELSIKPLLLEHLNRTTLLKDKTVLSLRLLARCSQLLNFFCSVRMKQLQPHAILKTDLSSSRHMRKWGYVHSGTSSVNKSSSPTDNSKQQDTLPTTNIQSSTEPTTPTTTVHAEENNDNQAEDAHFQPYEFVNPFCTPVQEIAESSSRNVDNSNMHTFYQPHQSEH